MKQYGIQSEGKHRRLGDDGRPRLLEGRDENQGAVKVINNPDAVVIKSPMKGFEPPVARDVFGAAQAVLDARGKTQRGISKTKDPGKYPASTRVYDWDCGYPMWGSTSGNRRVFTCGRYVNSSGRYCEHNTVDAEATLAFLLKVFRQQLSLAGGRAKLRERLLALARARRENPPPAPQHHERRALEASLADLEDELKLRKKNLGRAKTDEEYADMSEHLHALKAEVAGVRARLDRLPPTPPDEPLRDPEVEVDKAMALFDAIEKVAHDPAARAEIRPLLKRLNVNLWLRFAGGKKGKRNVRVLTAGLITTGNDPYPVRPYGDDGPVPDGDRRDRDGGGGGALPSPADVNKTSSAKSVDPAEDVSLCKAHRGERI